MIFLQCNMLKSHVGKLYGYNYARTTGRSPNDRKSYVDPYFNETEDSTEYPGDQEHHFGSSDCLRGAERVAHRHVPIQGDTKH